jgi:MoaA/NifB/PqqE/SkfB family radical SAM enzyme
MSLSMAMGSWDEEPVQFQHTVMKKNRNRQTPTFANINLLGKCNADCYFCLGKDIKDELARAGDFNHVPFAEWKNFGTFLADCEDAKIRNLYITGQNTDALLYDHLFSLIHYLQDIRGFNVGVRTNGFRAKGMIDTLNLCKRSVGYSIHSLKSCHQMQVMGNKFVPDWDWILRHTIRPRVAIVVTKHTFDEFFDIVKFVSKYPNVRYVQARRVSTDTRYDLLKEDIDTYEVLFRFVEKNYTKVGTFYDAEIFDIEGVHVTFWRTVETSVNSWNYFVDGTVSKEYFIVEGYLKNQVKPS